MEQGRLGQPAVETGGVGDEELLDSQAFISRDPIVSLLQTVLEERIEAEHRELLHEQAPGFEPGADPTGIPIAVESLRHEQGPLEKVGDPFTKTDPRWVTEIAKALVERWTKGKHPFIRDPAPEFLIADSSRVVLFSDWGTALPRAKAVGREIRKKLEEVAGGGGVPPAAHVVHLGDVYYSGDKREYEQRVLAPGLWPVNADEADTFTSWCLNGNHDMYSGGWAYYDNLLADERFNRQRTSHGRTTSFFSLVTPHWRILGLDTAWEDHLTRDPHAGYLQDPQAEFVAEAIADQTRKVMLLSHHQLFTVRGHVGPALERTGCRSLERPDHQLVLGSRAPLHGVRTAHGSPCRTLHRSWRDSRPEPPDGDPCPPPVATSTAAISIRPAATGRDSDLPFSTSAGRGSMSLTSTISGKSITTSRSSSHRRQLMAPDADVPSELPISPQSFG